MSSSEQAAVVAGEARSFGRWLAAAREARGLTLDDLAHVTKIRRGILEALEAENRRVLPEKVFVQGYVRTCAHALGLSADETLRRLAASWGDDAPRTAASAEAPAKPPRSYRWLPPALAGGLFVLVAWWVASLS